MEAGALALLRHARKRILSSCSPWHPTLYRRTARSKGNPIEKNSRGKDRTGFIAAILLSALGVAREVIYADYLLSLERWQGERSEAAIRRYLLPLCGQEPTQDVIHTLCQVKAIYLEAAFEEIEQKYGGIDGYLHLIGLDASAQDRLQALLLA